MALEQLGNLPLLDLNCKLRRSIQCHRQLVRQDSTMSGEHALYLFGSHFTTEHLNHNWSQQVHTYSGTCFSEANLS